MPIAGSRVSFRARDHPHAGEGRLPVTLDPFNRPEICPMRRLALAAAVLSLTACPTYDSYKYVASEKGLMAPDEFAKYGPDQAIAVAIGREFGTAYAGRDTLSLAKQADAAVAYGKGFAQVQGIVADTLGHRLVVTFADGWSAQVTPITDGKRGADTPGLPAAK